MFNYLRSVKIDVRNYIDENISAKEYSLEELESFLNDELFVDDSVTGNASGSYTFSIYEAEENLCHNMDLLMEVSEEYGIDLHYMIEKGPEYCDVSIRCYLLPRAISEVLEEYEEDFFKEV